LLELEELVCSYFYGIYPEWQEVTGEASELILMVLPGFLELVEQAGWELE